MKTKRTIWFAFIIGGQMKKRTIEIKLRLTPEEAKSLNDAVVSTGRSRESYLRSLISGCMPYHLPSETLTNTLNEIRYIGNNLNQIARVANKNGMIDSTSYEANVGKLFKELSTIRASIAEGTKIEISIPYGDY